MAVGNETGIRPSLRIVRPHGQHGNCTTRAGKGWSIGQRTVTRCGGGKKYAIHGPHGAPPQDMHVLHRKKYSRLLSPY